MSNPFVRVIRYPRPHQAIALLLGRRGVTLDWRWLVLSLGGPERYAVLSWPKRWGGSRALVWETGWTKGPGEKGYRGAK